MRVRRLKKKNDARALTMRLVNAKGINREFDLLFSRMAKPKKAPKQFEGGTNLGRNTPAKIHKIRMHREELNILKKYKK